MRLALEEAAWCLRSGVEMAETIRRSKAHASFGGSMRGKLVELLDFIGVNRFIERHLGRDSGQRIARSIAQPPGSGRW
jgi:hypothetical protein